MTNEEKTKELLGAPIQWTFNYWLDGFSEATQKELREKRNLLIKMAEWKDAQFKGYLEKIINKIQHQAGIIFRDIMKRRDDYSAFDEDFMRKVLRERMQEIINEPFEGE